jgi:hypothetical protein
MHSRMSLITAHQIYKYRCVTVRYNLLCKKVESVPDPYPTVPKSSRPERIQIQIAACGTVLMSPFKVTREEPSISLEGTAFKRQSSSLCLNPFLGGTCSSKSTEYGTVLSL